MKNQNELDRYTAELLELNHAMRDQNLLKRQAAATDFIELIKELKQIGIDPSEFVCERCFAQ